jgi:hypothetical protein
MTSVGRINRLNGLNILAYFNTAPALYTFVHAADKGCSFNFRMQVCTVPLYRRAADTEAFGKGLQFAFFSAYTGEAILRVICQKQFNDGFADALDTPVIGNDIHPFPPIIGAGRR